MTIADKLPTVNLYKLHAYYFSLKWQTCSSDELLRDKIFLEESQKEFPKKAWYFAVLVSLASSILENR